MMRAIVKILEGDAQQSAALATVIRRSGSAPQIEGARLLLRSDGSMLGTVGGGAIEALVLEACRSTLQSTKPQRVEANLIRDLAMCCGGSMEIFVEYLSAQPRLFLLGAGHVAQALAPLAAPLGYRVLVIDDREEMLAHPHFAALEQRCFDTDELPEAIPDIDPGDYFVIATRDHLRDERALAYLLRRPHAYIGMIGSQRKVRKIFDRIWHRDDERGQTRPDLSCVHAPIGLALGGRTPAEIAVSIAAQLVAIRNQGHGGSMSVLEQISQTHPDSPS